MKYLYHSSPPDLSNIQIKNYVLFEQFTDIFGSPKAVYIYGQQLYL